VAGLFERPQQPWATGGSGGFFQRIACTDIIETLNSFNFDVLDDINGLRVCWY
jgi:hypothetical protein